MSQGKTQTPYMQGRLLMTKTTASWTSDQRERADNEERRRVFSGFTAADEGCSRKLVAICQTVEDAEFIVTACNTHDQLVAALKAMMDRHSGVMVAADQRILDAGEAALAAAGAA